MFKELFSAASWSRDRRRHPRQSLPSLRLDAGAQSFATVDWSLSGCRIAKPTSRLKQRDRVEGTLHLQGDRRSGGFLAEVMRVTDEGDIGMRWLELDGHIMAAMAEYKPW